MNYQVVSEKLVDDRLEDKVLAVVEQVSTLRQAAELSQNDLAMLVGMDKGQFSRLMHGAENMTLATISRLEVALNDNILVTPDDYAESLVINQPRLIDIINATSESDPTFPPRLMGISLSYMGFDIESFLPNTPQFALGEPPLITEGYAVKPEREDEWLPMGLSPLSMIAKDYRPSNRVIESTTYIHE